MFIIFIKIIKSECSKDPLHKICLKNTKEDIVKVLMYDGLLHVFRRYPSQWQL